MPECIGCGRDTEAFEIRFSDNRGLCDSCFNSIYRRLQKEFEKRARTVR